MQKRWKKIFHANIFCMIGLHSITGLSQETRKISNKQPTFTLKGTRKRKTNKGPSEQKEGNNKKQSRICPQFSTPLASASSTPTFGAAPPTLSVQQTLIQTSYWNYPQCILIHIALQSLLPMQLPKISSEGQKVCPFSFKYGCSGLLSPNFGHNQGKGRREKVFINLISGCFSNIHDPVVQINKIPFIKS